MYNWSVNVINQVLNAYNSIFAAIPEKGRIYFAVIVLAFVIIAVIKMIQKNLMWIVVLILLLPAIIPALQLLGINLGFNPTDLAK